MDSADGLSLYPSDRCKTIHLVRHAQEVHKFATGNDRSSPRSDDYLDSKLSTFGWKQVDKLREHVQSSGLSKRIELVVTSPFLRTMQTAVGAFGGEYCSYDINVLPLMMENAGDSNRAAISSLNCPPFLAVEACREHLGNNPCDKRRSIVNYQHLFPAIDFSTMNHNDDLLCSPNIRETNEEVANRGLRFLKWLWSRKEKEIAVVSHFGFLLHTLAAFGNDCHPSIKEKIRKRFASCELRSIVLIDRSEFGLEASTTDFVGRSPRSRT